MHKILIIADSPSRLIDGDVKSYDRVICLDGIAPYAYEAGIKPHIVIGDLDNISQNNINSLRKKGVKIIKVDDQNTSDLDKGISLALSYNATEIHILNALGGRTDHTLYNLRALRKHYTNSCIIKIINGQENIQYFKDQEIKVQGTIGDNIAIMAMPQAMVNSKGLKYELTDYKMNIGFSESISNQLAKKSATIHIKGEVLIIYKN